MVAGVKPLSSARYTVPAVARAGMVLDAVAESTEPLSLAELARRLRVPKSSLLSVCSTLVQTRLLTRYEDGSYHLGVHVVNLARAYLARVDLAREFPRACDELGVLDEETLLLSVLDGRDVVYVGSRRGSRPIVVNYELGTRLPASCTATGKALLSCLPRERVDALYANVALPRRTGHSITSLEALHLELERIRCQGYATDDEEIADGLYAIAVPIFNSRGEPGAAVSAAMVKATVDADRAALAVRTVMHLADRLSAHLGAGLPPHGGAHTPWGVLRHAGERCAVK